MFEITAIIPAYGESELVERAVGSLAQQWQAKDYLHVIIVNDCSPNTDNDYQDLVDRYKHRVKSIKCIRTKENSGQGIARQTGIDACETEYFMLCDEDDMYSPIALYTYCDAYESCRYEKNEYGEFVLDDDGNKIELSDYVPIATIASSLEQVAPNNVANIASSNDLWVNSRLMSKKFLEEYGIRFHPLSSRHSEDYCWSQMVFPTISFSGKWTGILIDDNVTMYYWLENEKSQSRSDPFYSEMLAGWTCRSSVISLEFYEECEKHNLERIDELMEFFYDKLINNTVYNYLTFFHIIKSVSVNGYVPKHEEDWIIMRDAMNDLRKLMAKYWDNISYTQRMEQIYACKKMSDCRADTEPWVDLDEFCKNGCEELEWSYEDLMDKALKYKFNDKNVLISKGQD